jgi:hypothetical protein
MLDCARQAVNEWNSENCRAGFSLQLYFVPIDHQIESFGGTENGLGAPRAGSTRGMRARGWSLFRVHIRYPLLTLTGLGSVQVGSGRNGAITAAGANAVLLEFGVG